jgi:hypothetical protein
LEAESAASAQPLRGAPGSAALAQIRGGSVKGTMVTIPADEAQSLVVEQLSRPPDLMDVYKALGGSAEQVAYTNGLYF